MPVTVPELPFEAAALEPHISTRTVEIHYGKHHKGYVDKLNAALEDDPRRNESLVSIIRSAHEREDAAVFNPAAQVYNHNLYWLSLDPQGGGKPSKSISKLIDRDFGSLADFKTLFADKAATQFGSGWTWLAFDPHTRSFRVVSTSDAMTPLVAGIKPLVTLDVWEHAYYLDYQNERRAYIDAFLNHLINWRQVEECLNELPAAA